MPNRRLASVPRPDRGRAVAYIRVSAIAGRDAEQFHSPELQHRAITDLLGRRGLHEVAVVEDIDVTGRDFNRAGIRRILDMARGREIDVVALYDLSRLGRNTGESLRVLSELRDAGVTVVSTVEQIDDTPEGQFMLGQFLGMAQLYSDQLGRRWRQVHEHMAREGRQVGQAPIGYVQADTGRVTAKGQPIRSGPFTVDPVLGPAVARTFTDHAAGVPMRDLARRLGDARGRPIWPAQVRALLHRRFYLGFVTYRGVETRGVHVPLVDEATWEACQRRLAADSRTAARSLEVAHALTGLAVCDGCGSKAILTSSAEKGAGAVRRLTCARQQGLHDCAGCGSMRVDLVEAAVLEQVTAYLGRLRVDGSAQTGRRLRAAQAKADAARLRGELRRARAARARLAVDRARREIPADVYGDADRELADAEERIGRALAEAEVAQGVPPTRAAAAAAEMLRLWGAATAAERNRMLRVVVAEVRLRRAESYRQPPAERVEIIPR